MENLFRNCIDGIHRNFQVLIDNYNTREGEETEHITRWYGTHRQTVNYDLYATTKVILIE